MAGGIGKNSRGGKRGSSASSSSSYISTTTVIFVVGFCLYGIYMLSSSSASSSIQQSNNLNPHKRTAISSSSSSSSSLPRTVLRDPPPAAAGGSTEGAIIKIDNNSEDQDEQLNGEDQGEEKKVAIATASDGTEEVGERRQQEEEVETRQSNEELQQPGIEQQKHDEEITNQSEDQQQNDGITSGRSNEEDPDQNSNEQQQPQQDDEAAEVKNDDHEQQEDSPEEKNNDQQEKATEQTNDEQQLETAEQQQQQETMEQNNDEQAQSETNRQDGNQDESNNDNQSQQQSQSDTEDIQQDQNQQQHIEQVTDGTHSQSEEGSGGITSQSQIEHDTDGTTETDEQQEEQRQQQQRQQQQQQQKQQQMEQENAVINGGSNEENQANEDNPNASFPDRTEPAVANTDQKTWATQADQSSNEKERRKEDESSQLDGGEGEGNNSGGDGSGKSSQREWELCNVTAGSDYIPCLDNEKAIKQLHSFRHFEHRERHCPDEGSTCLVPLPKGYKRPIEWPQSRDRIWYNNVPRTKLAEVKGHQNWVKVAGEYLTFPGGGTQFIHGALHYIDFIQKSVPEIAWGKHTRVILDVGCGVASFGGYLFERDVLALSFAPKDEHEAQVQFALERGIPAISAVMGSQRLPFPSRVFDIVHCARCRVPWHVNDGALLLELNRVLRPGGFFVWSATPVYQKLKEDVEIWQDMTSLTKSMCWDLHTIKRDKLNSVGAAMYRKPMSNDCYDKRKVQKPPMCKEEDDPNAAWYVPLQSCMHRVPVDPSARGSQWPQEWPRRAQVPPYWLNNSQTGVYGRPAPDDFSKDYEHWKRVVNKSYLTGFGIDWSRVRNVMDMRAVYGGFAAALKDMKVWVMNLVNIDSPDTLPIIYERGLFGMYHDWCESFSTYPRTYDLLHADRLFSQVKKRCEVLAVIAEVDRIVRPGGKLIVRDESEVVSEVEDILKSLHWEIRLTYSKNQEGILCAEKSEWRPEKFSAST